MRKLIAVLVLAVVAGTGWFFWPRISHEMESHFPGVVEKRHELNQPPEAAPEAPAETAPEAPAEAAPETEVEAPAEAPAREPAEDPAPVQEPKTEPTTAEPPLSIDGKTVELTTEHKAPPSERPAAWF